MRMVQKKKNQDFLLCLKRKTDALWEATESRGSASVFSKNSTHFAFLTASHESICLIWWPVIHAVLPKNKKKISEVTNEVTSKPLSPGGINKCPVSSQTHYCFLLLLPIKQQTDNAFVWIAILIITRCNTVVQWMTNGYKRNKVKLLMSFVICCQCV